MIFGGMSARNQTYYDNTTGRNQSIYENCEAFSAQSLAAMVEIPDLLKNCGEEI